MTVEIGPAGPDVLADLLAIYNHYVVASSATFDLEPVPLDAAARFFAAYSDAGPHRIVVATRDGRPCGYATSGPLRSRPAYATSVETTVYLHPEATGQGLGSMLYDRLFADLRGEGLHRAYAVIALPNPASVELHRRFGFREVGTMHEVGRKFDSWWDVLWMEKRMAD